jgi:hypothetical protein
MATSYIFLNTRINFDLATLPRCGYVANFEQVIVNKRNPFYIVDVYQTRVFSYPV